MTIGLLVSLARAGAPDSMASCDEQAAWYELQVRPNPSARPTLWWIKNDPPCEYGDHLAGEPPPAGREVSCQDVHDRRVGWQTVFGVDGKVLLETHWFANREIGPRLEWDPSTYALSRRSELTGGKLDGESVEWLPDGGVVVITYRHGVRSGPTWRLDDRHKVLLIESWRGGSREGRSCAWRDDAWVEQVWKDGQPVGATGSLSGGSAGAQASP